MNFFTLLCGLLVLVGCNQKGAQNDDPVETSSIPINGDGADPLYARLLDVMGDLPPLAALLKSGVSDSVVCQPQTCTGLDLGSCNLLLNLSAVSRVLCYTALHRHADSLAVFGARPVESLFREATRPLVQRTGEGGTRTVTMMTKAGAGNRIVISRIPAMALGYFEFEHAVLHELLGHLSENVETGTYTGDLSKVPSLSGLEPGRVYADLVAAGGTTLVRQNLAAVSGSVDHSFNDGGSAVAVWGTGDDVIHELACPGDGKILAIGTTHNTAKVPFGVITRFNADGTLDAAYGTSGGKTFLKTQSATASNAAAVAALPDGKALVAGHVVSLGMTYGALFRQAADGTTEKILGASLNDILVTKAGDPVQFQAVFPTASGKILVAGSRRMDDGFHGLVARFDAEGGLDTAYGDATNGTLRKGYATNPKVTSLVRTIGFTAASKPSGALLLLTYDDRKLWLSQYTPHGVLDPDFGANGSGMLEIGFPNQEILRSQFQLKVALQSDGRIVLAAYSGRGGESDPEYLRIGRVLADGSALDPDFGEGGWIASPFGAENTVTGGGLLVQGNDAILFAGALLNGTQTDFMLTRFLPNGEGIDPEFNRGAPAIKRMGPENDKVHAICLQPGGKVVIGGGIAGQGSFLKAALARFHLH